MRWVLDDGEAREAGLLSLARSLAPARLAPGESVSEWRTWRERSRRGGPRDRAHFSLQRLGQNLWLVQRNRSREKLIVSWNCFVLFLESKTGLRSMGIWL